MRIRVLTIFPEILQSPLQESILKRAQQKGLVRVDLDDLRQFTTDPHRSTDDDPYGGGPGMIMKAEPLVLGLERLKAEVPGLHTILTCPQGRLFTQQRARELACKDALLFVCGHYGGVDERVRGYVDEELSIGDYVLTGGELAALVMMDAIIRLVPGVLGNEASVDDDSFVELLLNAPQYTRPKEFRGQRVPEVLLSGNHQQIRCWRRQEALKRTLQRRPELLQHAVLSREDRALLEDLQQATPHSGAGP
ncbi:MAG TPA: tRNA (guanosine(37)-N1)-methyltransferase TrmD [Candidatus Tectomicrobia bacterium]|nr:tRNA (guanosine(37)-N1)-methyltransferase TrmD [Candidatus Tectomicrobia bacterium]